MPKNRKQRGGILGSNPDCALGAGLPCSPSLSLHLSAQIEIATAQGQSKDKPIGKSLAPRCEKGSPVINDEKVAALAT